MISSPTPTPLSPSSSSEEFYESLDRILLSSCSSTSASDDDADHGRRRRHHRSSPPAPSPYDVWLSEPSSVEDRRRRLLHQMGLSGDDSTPTPRISTSPSVPRDSDPELEHHHHQQMRDSTSSGRNQSDNDENSDRFCTIRNLDDGSEFVVKDLLENDGVFNEVGTGRQITVEEFEMCVGRSPIVHELMRRQSEADPVASSGGLVGKPRSGGVGSSLGARWKKRGNWLRSIKNITGVYYKEKGGIDGTQVQTKVRQYGKSYKELTSLYKTQEITAHNGSIWCIKFSLDGQYLASAGEDRVIHLWQVLDRERKGNGVIEGTAMENLGCNPFLAVISDGSPEQGVPFTCVEVSHWERRRSVKSVSSDHVMVPEHIFALSEKPVCSFKGHLDDVLDLSWSKSRHLLSSSMDKTVKLWDMSRNSCLKTFTHSDYVTCIQFNPIDDRYFISGSLDEKVRIWSIPDRRVVDWNDLHEMITAVCYTPDGQGALVGSHKGNCHRYDTSDNKLHKKCQIDLQNKKKKFISKKITGFQFAPGTSSEVLITSADSKIWVVDGVDMIQKFKGFRNTSSQISASLSANGRYVICASEDSHVYVWRYDADPRPSGGRGFVPVTQSYEHFYCQDVTAAVSWPIAGTGDRPHGAPKVSDEAKGHEGSSLSTSGQVHGLQSGSIYNTSSSSPFGDRVSSTWPEEKLRDPQNCNFGNGGIQVRSRSAWGMVIVTAARGGGITVFQNFGFPIRI